VANSYVIYVSLKNNYRACFGPATVTHILDEEDDTGNTISELHIRLKQPNDNMVYTYNIHIYFSIFLY
jgi:S-ribosylhomocysteine lyase LuxS involved in autoinducer biosynthesis